MLKALQATPHCIAGQSGTYNRRNFEFSPACFSDFIWWMGVLPCWIVKTRMQLEDNLRHEVVSEKWDMSDGTERGIPC